MELREKLHKVGQHDHDQHAAHDEGQRHDDRRVDHRAADLLQGRVLTLQVARDLDQDFVEAAAVFRGAHHVDIQLVEHPRMVRDGDGEGLALI